VHCAQRRAQTRRATGDEPARAMSLAMADAGIEASEIDYVNLHGTSTLLNDRIETNALKIALNCNSHRVPMSATKSQVGHPQGASGACGIATTALALARQILPPTINQHDADPECDLDFVPATGRPAAVRAALCNCLGFGSKNSAVVLGIPD